MDITKELYRSRAHAKFFLGYHVVFATKYRKMLLRHRGIIQCETMHLFDSIAAKYHDFEILRKGMTVTMCICSLKLPVLRYHHVRLYAASKVKVPTIFGKIRRWLGYSPKSIKTSVLVSGVFCNYYREVDVDTVQAYIYSQGIKRKRR